MFLDKPNESDLKEITLDKFEEDLMKHVQPERSKREDQDFWEAEEYDGIRPCLFKVFKNEEEAKRWVNKNPDIRKCRKFVLDAVL